jgi:hypothetical protein
VTISISNGSLQFSPYVPPYALQLHWASSSKTTS